MKKNGFTILELVVIVAILAILGAIAIPKFFTMNEETRKSVLANIKRNIHNAVALTEAKYKLQGNDTATVVCIDGSLATPSTCTSGSSIAVTASTAIPKATAAGIGTAIRVDVSGESGLNTDYSVTASPCTATHTCAIFYYGSSGTSSTCRLTYDENDGTATEDFSDCNL